MWISDFPVSFPFCTFSLFNHLPGVTTVFPRNLLTLFFFNATMSSKFLAINVFPSSHQTGEVLAPRQHSPVRLSRHWCLCCWNLFSQNTKHVLNNVSYFPLFFPLPKVMTTPIIPCGYNKFSHQASGFQTSISSPLSRDRYQTSGWTSLSGFRPGVHGKVY